MSKEELTYEQAMQRLEEITESFEQNTLELDRTGCFICFGGGFGSTLRGLSEFLYDIDHPKLG